jgi:hypothetical protein
VSEKLFLLWASQGEYSDRSEWAVALYTREEDAASDVKRGEALHRDIRNRAEYDYEKRKRLLRETEEGAELRRIMGQDEVSFYDDLTLYACEIEIRTAAAGKVEE